MRIPKCWSLIWGKLRSLRLCLGYAPRNVGMAAWKGYATDYGVPLDDSTTSYGDNGRAILFGWRRPQALGAGDRRHEQSRLGGRHARHPKHPGRIRTVHGHGLHVASKAGFQPLQIGRSEEHTS